MKLEDVYTYLCDKDPRSDGFLLYKERGISPTPRINCGCYNCFYGKDKLALEIISLNEKIKTIDG